MEYLGYFLLQGNAKASNEIGMPFVLQPFQH